MFKRIVNKIFKKNVVTAVNDPKPIQLDGLRIISLWTAGVKYESRINNVLNCKVHDEVMLARESNNEIDKNAIHVKTLNGLSLVYIGRL
jgi:hypothetical protein